MASQALKQHMTGEKDQPEPNTVQGILTSPKMKLQIAAALPKHLTPERYARVALTEMRKNPELAACEPKSFLGALMQAAQLGLEPGGALGHAYLIPFKRSVKRGNTWEKIQECQIIIGYRGMIDLARRSGQIVSLSARAVYEKDRFSYEYGLEEKLEHVPYEGADAGALTHVYSVAKIVGGGIQFEVMGVEKIKAIRDAGQGYTAAKKAAEEYNKPINSPWESHFEEMAKKTVIRRLFKYLPVSIEVQRAVGLDEQADANISQHNSSVIEGDFITDPPTEELPTNEPSLASRVHDALVDAKTTAELDAAWEMIDPAEPLPKSEQTALGALYTKRSKELEG
jgi:recombination protein RecT